MINADAPARNFLQKDGGTSLAIVKVDVHGRPDSVSYWKNTAQPETRQPENSYERGILLDMWL